MKNKEELKKCLFRIGLVSIRFCALAVMLHLYEWSRYQREYNKVLGEILIRVKENYPEVSEKELIGILNGQENDSDDSQAGTDRGNTANQRAEGEAEDLLKRYGIDLEKDAAILTNEKQRNLFLALWLVFILIFGSSICILFLHYNRKKDKELLEITRYIEEINQKNYTLELESMAEDELSMLKTEIYKTTIMLKEVAENSRRDKANLKDALSDISHQMKTPLTSILIILDDIIDDPDMEPEVRQDFIRDVKREITHIQFLVQSLLKMTKLDSGTVTFIRENVTLSQIAREAMKNVSALCDLKNVGLETHFTEEDSIFCDYHWQVEAITNILKNCVEHAPIGNKVIVKTQKNQVYGAISITDFGPGIDEEDRRHLFERFYRGKNASADGVGIGLSLAKTIVESDGGRIFVDSDVEKTVFEVKYFL